MLIDGIEKMPIPIKPRPRPEEERLVPGSLDDVFWQLMLLDERNRMEFD